MTNVSLAESYMIKASKRLKILYFLFDDEGYSDVIREAQEVVELAQKAMLRQVGIDPPKWHDVGSIILENSNLFDIVYGELEAIARISKWLRKERELSFYGDIDFIPTEEYTPEDALKAIEGAKKVVEMGMKVVKM